MSEVLSTAVEVIEETPAGAVVDAAIAADTAATVKSTKKPPKEKKEKEKKVKPAPVHVDLPKATRLTDVADFNGVAGGKIGSAYATMWKIDGMNGVYGHVLTVKEKIAADPAKLQATLAEQEATIKARGATLELVATPIVARMAVKGEGVAVFVRLPSLETAMKECLMACGVS